MKINKQLGSVIFNKERKQSVIWSNEKNGKIEDKETEKPFPYNWLQWSNIGDLMELVKEVNQW